MLADKIRRKLSERRQERIKVLVTLAVPFISVIGAIVLFLISDNTTSKHANETQTAVAISNLAATNKMETDIAGYTATPTRTATSTLTPTATLTPTLTPTPTIGFNTITARPTEEITYCSNDVLNPAGIRVIARWPAQNKRGFYIAVEKRTAIVYFRVKGWDYLPPTQLNTFVGEKNSDICGNETPWLVWSDSHSTDAASGSIISIEFLDVNQKIIVSVTFSVNADGLGLTHIDVVR